MPAFLEQYFDPGREPDAGWNIEQEIKDHVARLADEAAMAHHAQHHPRRLGQDATPRQLARDTLYAKRTMYGAISLINAWGVPTKEAEQLIANANRKQKNKSSAAQVDWEEHLQNKIVTLRDAQRRIATNGKHHELVKPSNKALLRIENEIRISADRYERVFGNPISTKQTP